MENVLSVLVLVKNQEDNEELCKNLNANNRTCVIGKRGYYKRFDNFFSFENPKIIFMDTSIPEIVYQKINYLTKKLEYKPKIVYTVPSNFKIEGIEENENHYILKKPYDSEDINDLIKKIKHEIDEEEKELFENLKSKLNDYGKIKLQCGKRFVFLVPNEIIYIQAFGCKCEIVRKSGDKEIINSRISQVFKYLKHFYFFRAGRSLIVNLNYLYTISKKNNTFMLKCQELEYVFKISLNVIKYFEKLESIKI